MGVSVKVDLDGVTRKLSQANLNRGQYAMANQMLADMNLELNTYKCDVCRHWHLTRV